MACCKACCGCANCAQGDQGKCCCGGASGTCCQANEYCCGGSCQAGPCQPCTSNEDCYQCNENYSFAGYRDDGTGNMEPVCCPEGTTLNGSVCSDDSPGEAATPGYCCNNQCQDEPCCGDPMYYACGNNGCLQPGCSTDADCAMWPGDPSFCEGYYTRCCANNTKCIIEYDGENNPITSYCGSMP